MADEHRTVMVAARVTPREHAAWREEAAAAGVSPSALLREAMARTRTWTTTARAVERERTRQIARIGNNLNQLVRWASNQAEIFYGQVSDLEGLIGRAATGALGLLPVVVDA